MGTVLSLGSTLLLGLMAGFFATYSFNVNYAMLEVNGEMYAIVQSLFNQNVRHAGFFFCFFGAGAAPLLTAVYWFTKRERKSGWAWLVIALAYILGIIVFTRFINLPLNYYTESWNPMAVPEDWEAIRASWNDANLFRAVLSIGLFAVALVIRELWKPKAP